MQTPKSSSLEKSTSKLGPKKHFEADGYLNETESREPKSQNTYLPTDQLNGMAENTGKVLSSIKHTEQGVETPLKAKLMHRTKTQTPSTFIPNNQIFGDDGLVCDEIKEDQDNNHKKFSSKFTTSLDGKRKNSPLISNYLKKLDKELLGNNSRNQLRGEGPDTGDSVVDYSGLLAKFKHYKEKSLNDTTYERELNLYVELKATSDSADNEDKSQVFGLAFDIWKNFLNCSGPDNPIVLLLTGQAGVGKSLFCRHFHQEVLFDWNESQHPQSDEGLWFPIYIELSSLKNPRSQAISETLQRELALTEEEIQILQVSQESKNSVLPQLLFIFDGYDEVEALKQPQIFKSNEDWLCNNFSVLNKIGESWKNVKTIITCREEYLQDIKRRDLLFAPINAEAVNLSSMPGSFLERKIVPFTNEQITCFLKKNAYFGHLKPFKARALEYSLPFRDDASVSEGSSWDIVLMFEKLINDYQLRELSRIPSLLQVMITVLPNLAADCHPEDSPQQLSIRSLIGCFVNITFKKLAKSIIATTKNNQENDGNKQEIPVQKQEDHLVKKMHLQAQDLALRLSGYSSSKAIDGKGKNDDNSLLVLCSFLKWNNSLFKAQFNYPMLREYFVAKSIEDELIERTSSIQNENMNEPTEFLLNRILLTSADCYSAIITPFLRDAVRDGLLSATDLMNIIHLSHRKNLKHQVNNSLSPFAIAAANAITILNTAGYDLSNKDFSNICIPGANLTGGIIEAADFTKANLKGVKFRDAWLKRATFEQAQMENSDFGEITNLKLRSKVLNIAFSTDGNYFAADLGQQTVIFEQSFQKSLCLKELRRLPGRFPQKIDSPFSSDGERILTITGNSLLMWDIASGKSLNELKNFSKNEIHVNSVKNGLVFFFGTNLRKYNVKSNSWTRLTVKASHQVTNCDANSGSNKILLVGDSAMGANLYDLTTARLISRKHGKSSYYKFSSEGRQIASEWIGYEIIRISDCVRGHAIKALENRKLSSNSMRNCSLAFSLDGKLIFSATENTLIIQDAAMAKAIKVIPFESSANNLNYSLNSTGKQVAVIKNNNTISFIDLSDSEDLSNQPMTIRGINSKGLDLKGANIVASMGLSNENIKIFQGEGVYDEFDEQTIKQLFLLPFQAAKDIKEINLADEKLTLVSAVTIGRDSRWINLQKLDLSMNRIGDEGAVVIVDNSSWGSLQELLLNNTGIGDKAAVTIAKNQTWKSLKKLQLASNKIGDAGAAEIGWNRCWVNLETLDLHQNEIADKGATSIAECDTWINLTALELSFNKISDKRVLVYLCRNRSWKNLKVLTLQGNPAELQNEDILDMLKELYSPNLQVFGISKMRFDKTLLYYFKHAWPQDVVEIILGSRGYTDLNVGILGCNTTWTELKKLDLSKNRITDETASKILSNPAWTNLEEIDLSGNQLGEHSIVEFGKNKAWNKLKVINFNGNKIGSGGAGAIGASKSWPDLQVLDLGGSNIGNQGVADLIMNKSWTNLQTLILKSDGIDVKGCEMLNQNSSWTNLQVLNFADNTIGDAGAEELSKNTIWRKLQTLDLENNSIGAKGVNILCNNTLWTMLKTLNLRANPIKDEGAEVLGKSTNWRHLQALILEKCSIGDKGAEELSKNTTWTELDTLNLRSNVINSEGAVSLSKNAVWTKLQTLDLKRNSIGGEGVRAISNNPSWANLQTVTIGYNSIRAEGIEELSKNTLWKNLQSLDLESSLIGDEGAVKLSRNTSWTNLNVLNLRSNSIGTEGVKELSQKAIWAKLHTLDLAWNDINDKGIEELSKNKSWNNLSTLNLGHNSISAQGVIWLSENKIWSNLTSLNLGHNALAAKGAEELSKNLTWKNLQILCLESNAIGSDGATRLSKNTSWIDLRALNLRSNFIDTTGARELSKNSSWRNLQTLDLLGNDIY